MKKRTQKDFNKFTKRNTHKRRKKDEARRELLKAVAETEVKYSGIVLKDSQDLGRKARISTKHRCDEITGRGIFSGSKGGFGFVTLESGYERDIFIPEDRTHGAVDGDFVEIIFHIYNNRMGEEKTEGRVTKIIQYGRDTVIGTLYFEMSHRSRRRYGNVPVAYVIPDDPKVALRPRIYDTDGASDGDKVSVKLVRDGIGGYSPEAYIVANFGDSMSKDANYLGILAECGIPDEFTSEELEQAQIASQMKVDETAVKDLRSKVIFTIDGESAKDLDDAISLSKLKKGWKLGVHIADVSRYVEEKTALDRLVMSRGTSVYFTDKVVPMLPPSLSNGACSLNFGEDKYTLSAEIELDNDGNIVKTEIYPSVIRSRVRGVYSEVNSIFDGTADSKAKEKYKVVLPTLRKMHELYELLEDKAIKRGYVNMDIDETRILLDDGGTPIDVVRCVRGDAEKMIEQFMLCANEAVASLLNEKGIPCVYRIHEKPSSDKLDGLVTYLKHIGLDPIGIDYDTVTGLDFSNILAEAEEKGMGAAVSHTMLRSMMKAKYSEIRMPHFGLGLENYCHFTSPIRRLSDLATHRIIHRVLIEGKRPEAYRSYAKRAARAATDTEQRAITAERRIEDLYKVIYMSDRIGDTFDAVVSSVTSFGLFAELDNTCEGLIPMSEMPGLFTFYENDMTIRHRDMVFRLGDNIRVRLEEADMIRGKLRFSLVL